MADAGIATRENTSASTSVTSSVWKAVHVTLIWYNSTIWHVQVLRSSLPRLYAAAHKGWLVKRARHTKVRWIIISSTWPLRSADPIALEGMNATLIRAIILPSVNSWEGQRRRFPIAVAVPDFAESSIPIWGRRRGCYSRRVSTSQQIPFKDNPD